MKQVYVQVLLVLVLCGCAVGSPETDVNTDPDAGTSEFVACSQMGEFCSITTDCCQSSGSTVCAATSTVSPTCMKVCETDTDCCTPGDACGTCLNVIGQNFGVCE